jgi:rSAM/selenodomain-associated transferase 2
MWPHSPCLHYAFPMPVSVSIVIPILNEADQIPTLVDSLRKLGEGIEVLFVDGGSTDEGPSLVRMSGYSLITSAAGRARQMNTGARATSGEVLIFLHADVRLPPDSLLVLRIAMRDRGMVYGHFELMYDTRQWPYPWIAGFGNARSRLTGLATGDQTIFVRRHAFDAVGGYPEIPLMEDIALMRRLKRLGRLACLRAPVVGSRRKYEREGLGHTIMLMWLVRGLYAVGASPRFLHRVYYRRDPGKHASQHQPSKL